LRTESPGTYRPERGRAAVAIGNFDGVHIGHREIFRQVCAQAERVGGDAAVLTFSPHPTKVVRADPPSLIQTEADKLAHIADCGIHAAIVQRFDQALAALAPEAFIRQTLVEHLQAAVVLVGENFRFGRAKSGDVQTLEYLGARLRFRVYVVPAVTLDGAVVSSSRVRADIAAGRVAEAARLLGRDYAMHGEVVHGAGRGSTIGVPTANIAPEPELQPGHGVYVARVRHSEGWSDAVVNVGRAPTFGEREVIMEAHLLDYAGDLFGERLEVRFVDKLRDEQRFDGVDALVAQIRADITAARTRLAG